MLEKQSQYCDLTSWREEVEAAREPLNDHLSSKANSIFVKKQVDVLECSERNVASSTSCIRGDAHATCSPDVDGGWAWVVAVAAFIQFCISSGMYYSFSVFFVELLQTFEETRAKTGWVYSTNSAVHMFCGPLGGWVISRWGPRVAVMLGGIFAALGYVMTAFAPNLNVIFFTYGFVNAVGTSLNFSGWIVGLTRFWKRRHALAVGIIMSGSGFGVFFLGPVMEIIVHEYGWRGAMLICAGMSFNFSVCGATIYSRLRQPTLERGFCKENKLLMVVANDMEKAVASCDSDINDTSEESFHSNDIFESEAHLETKTLTETLAVQPPVAIGSVWSLAHHHPQNQQCQHLHDWKSSMKRRIRDKTSPKNQCTGTEVITMRQLLRSPTFWLLEASCFFSFMATTTVYAVFLDWTVWSGLAVAFSAALSGSGAGDILGRMLAGFIMGQGLPPLILFSGIQFLLSVTIGCASISSAPWQLVAAMVGMGVACGLQSVLYALMPSQLTSGARVGHVLGYLLFVTGAGALSGPPIAGFIVDKMESYAPVLILCTAAPAAAALLNYIAHCTSRSLTSPVPQTLTCNSNK
nr:monocarboxylate transporter 13-like isoform X2 [Procambarus clarkii]